jgi:hypothetical protein
MIVRSRPGERSFRPRIRRRFQTVPPRLVTRSFRVRLQEQAFATGRRSSHFSAHRRVSTSSSRLDAPPRSGSGVTRELENSVRLGAPSHSKALEIVPGNSRPRESRPRESGSFSGPKKFGGAKPFGARKFDGEKPSPGGRNSVPSGKLGPDGQPRVKVRARDSFIGKNKGRPKPKGKSDE